MSESRKPSFIDADGIDAPFAVEDVAWDEFSHGMRYRQPGEGQDKAATIDYRDGQPE
ncbi:MAG: hypothetical protein HYZ65_12725 [Burkholderiales bacterium]|nr:hypothetical protein [Burkholderiales bacterium]